MTGQRESRSGDSGRSLWRHYKRNRSGPRAGESLIDPLEMAAYLDDGLGEHERTRLEDNYADDPKAVELLAASSSALGEREEAPAYVVARATALVADPVAAENKGLMEWLRGYLGAPWRPAVAASAFGLYALLCLASFGLGAGIGLPGEGGPTQEESGVDFEPFETNDDWM